MIDVIVHNLQEQLDRIEKKIDNRFQKVWLTYDEVITSTGFSKSTVSRAIKLGHLESVKTGGRRMFKQSWIDQWIGGGK